MTRINILTYHRVGDFPQRMPSHRGQYCHVTRFESQMQMLSRAGYAVISLDEAAASLRGETVLPPRPVVLTFDDGYVDFLEYAAPILDRHGYPAVVYAVAGMLGETSQWVAPEGLTPAPLMTAAQLREAQSMGFTIGSHTLSHPRLASLKTQAVVEEVSISKRMLEDVLGTRVDHFCYPYGSHDIRAVEAAADAGYVTGTTCLRAIATPEDDLLSLPRKPVSQGNTAFGVLWKLLTKNTPRSAPIRRGKRPETTLQDRRIGEHGMGPSSAGA